MTRIPLFRAARGASAARVAAGLGVALTALVTGCQTTPSEEKPPATVEARPAAPAPAAPAPKPEAKPVERIDLTAKETGAGAASPLKDPASILSTRSIYYDFDKFDIKDDYKPVVDAHAKYLREHPDAKMLIQGNTDERGSREYNIALGQRRSDGVRRLIILLGGREEQIEAVSLGEEKPKAQGTSEDAYAQNRRSDILYRGEY
jgi:peptidoglycan-associated lipoprotein